MELGLSSPESSDECYPKDKIIVSTTGSFMALSWVWDLTEPCSKYGVAGVAHESIVAIDNDLINLSFNLGGKVGSGRFSVNGNTATFEGMYVRRSCSLVREEPPKPEVNWAGTWILKSTSPSTHCYPKEQVVISKLDSSVTFSWIWASTETCNQLGLANIPFTKTIQTPNGNSATLHYLVGSSEITTTFNIEGDLATFTSGDDNSFPFNRQLNSPAIEWAGTWNLKTTSTSNSCYPKEKITITTTSSTLTYSWVWDTTETCVKAGLSGKNFEETIPIPSSNSVILKYDVEGAETVVILSVNGDVAQFSTTKNDASCTFARHIPVINWAGTWILKTTSTGTSCYPKEQIYVGSSEDSVTYSWVWDSNENCKQLGLCGKPFTKTVSTPKGNSVTLNFIVEGSETSVVFTVNEDKATFKGLKEASCTFDRQTEKPVTNWAGTWIIKTTSPAESCYPKEKVTISTASTSITYNWVWDSSESCNKLGLSGKTFEKTTSVPNGNLVPLHFQAQEAEVYGILVINGDKASFNNLEGASCTFERKIDDGKKDDDKKEEKKSTSNGFTIWLIIFFVTIAGIGFCIYRKRKEDQLSKVLAADSPTKSFLNA